MLAAALTCGMVACWAVIGYALTSWLLPRRQALSNLLLAPVVGMGTLELVAHAGLRLGSPLGPIAPAIAWTSLLLALVSLLVRRPPLPVKRAWPFAFILLVAVPLSAWPLFRWGGDWVANANGDMGNYCFAATGFRDHGYLAFHVEDYLSGRDLTQGAWFLYSPRVGHRHGSESMLAMTAQLTSRPAPMIFMPTIVAMHLTLICALGFLTCRLSGGRKVALTSCALLAVSPLSTYGVVQQLIAQVGGLALLLAALGLFLRPARRLSTTGCIKRSALGGIVGAALILHYVEIVPFLVAGFGLHVAIGFARGQRDFKQVAVALTSAACAIPLLGGFLVESIHFLLTQTSAERHNNPVFAVIFPQFLNGEGFARLWGFATLYEPVAVRLSSPWPVHRLVIFGSTLALLSLTAGVALAWRRRPMGVMLLVMLGVTVHLFRSTYAFALFKLAMYAQPFILGSVVLGWSRMKPGRWKLAATACLLTLVALQLPTQYRYVSFSNAGQSGGGALPGATQERLLTQLSDVLQTPDARRFAIPILDPAYAKLAASCSRDRELNFPVGDVCLFPLMRRESMDVETLEGAKRIRDRERSGGRIALLDSTDPTGTARITSYVPSWVDGPERGDYLLDLPNRLTPFNRFHRSSDCPCRAIPLNQVANYLLWRPTSRSEQFHPGGPPENSGLCGLQFDPAFPQHTMVASGRYVAFHVLNPSPTVRVMVDGTVTYVPGKQFLPPLEVIGTERSRLRTTGTGAVRVISEPIRLQTIGASKFLILDLSPPQLADPTIPPGQRDIRPISAYLRDVSVLSEDDYRAIVPPECVGNFPVDLADKRLEFSGCDEYRWVEKQSWFRLSRPEGAARLAVRGTMPQPWPGDPQTNDLVVKWNGSEVGRKTISPGVFELLVPAPPGVGPGILGLEFSQVRLINPPHPRTGSVQLQFVGYER